MQRDDVRFHSIFDLYPPEYRDDFLVLHDGIDVERFRRKTNLGWRVPRAISGRTLTPQARAVCVIEQLIGALFVAILIARLAGVYPSSRRSAGG